MSEKSIQIIHNSLTGKTLVKELTEKEVLVQTSFANETNQFLESQAAARESALAKLAALGLTEEEIGAL
jgi:DNA-binding NarL/FixJ family response regulator